LGGVVAGALGLLLAGVLDLGRVAVFGLALAAGLDLAFRDGGLVRLTVPALDLVFALLLVFVLLFVFALLLAFALLLVLAAALPFADFVFFLATMRVPLCSEQEPASVATPTTKPNTQVDWQDAN
jgi:hypothetical protein